LNFDYFEDMLYCVHIKLGFSFKSDVIRFWQVKFIILIEPKVTLPSRVGEKREMNIIWVGEEEFSERKENVA
jgi:hypothetical protein